MGYFESNSRTPLAFSSVAFFNSVLRWFESCAPAFLNASRTSRTFFSAALTSSIEAGRFFINALTLGLSEKLPDPVRKAVGY